MLPCDKPLLPLWEPAVGRGIADLLKEAVGDFFHPSILFSFCLLSFGQFPLHYCFRPHVLTAISNTLTRNIKKTGYASSRHTRVKPRHIITCFDLMLSSNLIRSSLRITKSVPCRTSPHLHKSSTFPSESSAAPSLVARASVKVQVQTLRCLILLTGCSLADDLRAPKGRIAVTALGHISDFLGCFWNSNLGWIFAKRCLARARVARSGVWEPSAVKMD
ncbi:hypothetical protein BKA64DRAFT_369656 [Cadophora sp. MPI-SDFR-AT-0126]|nr:hypothetical protein BKA64DRAFT_369656 [Leotiomycetes sp. MPI-SDFR-AT-0126]